MKQQQISVYDSKAKCFITPFFMQNTEVAKRLFQQAINDPAHNISKNPSDYTLFHVGEFDDDTGITTSQEKISLGNGVEFITQPEPVKITEYDGEN